MKGLRWKRKQRTPLFEIEGTEGVATVEQNRGWRGCCCGTKPKEEERLTGTGEERPDHKHLRFSVVVSFTIIAGKDPRVWAIVVTVNGLPGLGKNGFEGFGAFFWFIEIREDDGEFEGMENFNQPNTTYLFLCKNEF